MVTTQVLIVGAGPVGQVSALSLARAGIRCLIVDRRLERSDAPKAHAVNPRTLEICERLGVSADAIRANGASIAEGGAVHFVDVLNGTCFGSLPYERQDDGAREFTPWPLVNIAQPELERALALHLDQTANVSVLRGVTATRLEQDARGVTATLQGNALAEALSVRADYVIAADGANSQMRDALGIGLAGPAALQHFAMMHFEADLRALTREHPGLLYFSMSPSAQGVFIGYDRASNWVFMHSYDPTTHTSDDFDPMTCRGLIEAAAGAPLEALTVKKVSQWTMSAQVADAYGDGRVFLAGDAAHRFPPTGGLGLNTGVADAQNLAWKLARVLHGRADPRLLDTYETERRPIAQINSHQSLTNSAKLIHLFGALYGPDPARTADHYRSVCADPSAYPAIADAVEIQRPHFDSFNLQLGYRYGTTPDVETMDISVYEPSYEIGDYLPHLALVDDGWLLGQLPMDEFALVTGPSARAWVDAGIPVFTEGVAFKPSATAFYESANIERDGALLVRPDGHICARWSSAPAQPQEAIQRTLATITEN